MEKERIDSLDILREVESKLRMLQVLFSTDEGVVLQENAQYGVMDILQEAADNISVVGDEIDKMELSLARIEKEKEGLEKETPRA